VIVVTARPVQKVSSAWQSRQCPRPFFFLESAPRKDGYITGACSRATELASRLSAVTKVSSQTENIIATVGQWGFVGAVGAVAVMTFTNIGPWWTLGIAVVVGWAVNAWERVVRKRIAEMESKRD